MTGNSLEAYIVYYDVRSQFSRPQIDLIIYFSPPNKNGRPKIDKRNGKGETSLHTACIKGNLEMVKDYLALGANANTQDHSGLTPLHEACQRGFLDIVKVLLDARALPSVPGGCQDLEQRAVFI